MLNETIACQDGEAVVSGAPRQSSARSQPDGVAATVG